MVTPLPVRLEASPAAVAPVARSVTDNPDGAACAAVAAPAPCALITKLAPSTITATAPTAKPAKAFGRRRAVPAQLRRRACFPLFTASPPIYLFTLVTL